MRRPEGPLAVAALALLACSASNAIPATPETLPFSSGTATLYADVFRPAGPGPFPAVLYHHGSAPGLLNRQAAADIGPRFAAAGWLFVMPWRRGQGPSADAGPYIGDELAAARRQGGLAAAGEALTRRMTTTDLDDQRAALAWLKARPDVVPSRVAAAGNSFGGIQAVLGAALGAPTGGPTATADTATPPTTSRKPGAYCAVTAASVASDSWASAPSLQQALLAAARDAQAPVLLFQARNDHDLAPHRALLAALQAPATDARPVAEARIYPAFGRSARDGHAFAWQGADQWFADVLHFLQTHCP